MRCNADPLQDGPLGDGLKASLEPEAASDSHEAISSPIASLAESLDRRLALQEEFEEDEQGKDEADEFGLTPLQQLLKLCQQSVWLS